MPTDYVLPGKYENEEEEDVYNGEADDEYIDEEVEYIMLLNHLMLGLLFEISLPIQCSITG